MELSNMPDIVYLKTQDECNGVFQGTKDNGFKYLRFNPVRESAPDLYRALELILNSDMAMREEDEGEISTVLSIARAAIAKAEGK